MPKWTPAQLTLARKFDADYQALERRACSRQQWLQLKFSCSPLRAARLVRALDAESNKRTSNEGMMVAADGVVSDKEFWDELLGDDEMPEHLIARSTPPPKAGE